MNLPEYAYVSSRAYSTLLKDLTIFGKLFQSKQLAFLMEAQTQTNWCWAATATSVSHFYWSWSSWTQCKVAGAELGRTDCCNSTVPSACNVPWYLDKALTRTKNFVSITGQVSFQQVRDEIDAGRPVGARIGWNGGGGHFMVIYGYSRVLGTEYFDIDDPIYGKSHLTVSDFSTNYQGSGSWTHTYFTKSYIKMPFKLLYPKELILRRIWEIRPLLKMKEEPSFGGEVRAEDERAALGAAHRVFTLGLDAFRGRKDAAQPQPAGLRIYEITGETPTAYFDVTEDDEPRVVQMSSSRNQLDPFARALSVALTAAGDAEAELRFLRVPALNFEALWIHHGSEGKDVIVPLRPAGKLVPDRPVPYTEALAALREAARPLADMDDTMGA